MTFRIHNPCNEHTRNYKNYNLFWDELTDELKKKYTIIENRYFEDAHKTRFNVNFKSLTDTNGLCMMECEYIIENMDTGHFYILSVADDLTSCILNEQHNPKLKKVLISQFIDYKIKNHIGNNDKYMPWIYFQSDLTDLEPYYNKRNPINKKLLLRDMYDAPIIDHFDSSIVESIIGIEKSIEYKIALSVSGSGELCYRDIECMALGIPFLRFEFQTSLYEPLIPNVHYISVDYDKTIPTHNGVNKDRLGEAAHAKQLENRYKEVIDNDDFLNFISKNARKYYEDNLSPANRVKKTLEILDLDNVTPDPIKAPFTLVTGLFNINRTTRSYEHYIKSFRKLITFTKNIPMVIYIEEGDRHIVESCREKNNTIIRIQTVDEFKTHKHFDKINNIRTNPEWVNSAGWLKDSAQSTLPYYNPLVMSKIKWLNNEAQTNEFDSDYYFWVDGGLMNTVSEGYFTTNMFDRITQNLNEFLFIAFPYKNVEIHGFNTNKMIEYANVEEINYVCRGGFFGGPQKTISNVYSLYDEMLTTSLNDGYMGTEESIFTIISYKYPNLFNINMIEENGLIYKFFEDIKQKTSTNTVGLYIITYNAPKQLEELLNSMNKYDVNLLNNTDKFLLDNSSESSTYNAYVKICKTYNFKHIKKDNLGICGGRQFIAEHFDKTNLEYYLFFEDDMMFYNNNDYCKNGFIRNIPDFLNKVVNICNVEKFDFLKFNFTEFFGDNSTQWAWYNVPQHVRNELFPENPDRSTERPPRSIYKNIKSYEGLAYATGNIYYCNGPQIVSRIGNTKMFLTIKWARPYEQTWMSFMYQETIKKTIIPGILLATPTEHNRFEFYSDRKES